MTDSPTLSVVIPAYNGAETISDALDSLAAQSVPLRSVVVVDDGSTDGTAEVVRSHPLQPTLIRQPANLGVAVARNTGTFNVDATHVAFLDQDDLWHRDFAAVALDHLGRHPEHGALLVGEKAFALEADRAALEELPHPFLEWIRTWVPDARMLLDERADAPLELPAPFEVVPASRLLAGTVTVTTSYVFDRRLLCEAGGFASWLRSADDWVLLQAISRLTPIVRLQVPAAFYRVHLENTSLSTDWAIPLLLANAAVRNGGNVVTRNAVHDPAEVGRLTDTGFLLQLFASHIAAEPFTGVADAWRLKHFLTSDADDRKAVNRWLTRATLGVVRRTLRSPQQAFRGLRR